MAALDLRRFAAAALLGAAFGPMLPGATMPQEPPATAAAPVQFDLEPSLAALANLSVATLDEKRTPAAAAWTVLALLASGSTLRTGPHRAVIRKEITWLRAQQDDAGRFAPAGRPCGRDDQMLAALAMVETCLLSNYSLLRSNAAQGTAAAATALLRPTAAPATTAEFAWALLLARSVPPSNGQPMPIEWDRRALAAARRAMLAGKVRLADAALHLDELHHGKPHPPELTAQLTWPANLTADPLHTLLGAIALCASPMPAKVRGEHFAALERVVAARLADGEHLGTWPPAAGFDRVATTAMHTITLALAARGPTLLSTK